MLDASMTPGEPMAVRFTFWQAVKVGMGFTLGAGIMTVVGFVFYYAGIVLVLGGLANLATRH